jgi:hypothetical protein
MITYVPVDPRAVCPVASKRPPASSTSMCRHKPMNPAFAFRAPQARLTGDAVSERSNGVNRAHERRSDVVPRLAATVPTPRSELARPRGNSLSFGEFSTTPRKALQPTDCLRGLKRRRPSSPGRGGFGMHPHRGPWRSSRGCSTVAKRPSMRTARRQRRPSSPRKHRAAQ